MVSEEWRPDGGSSVVRVGMVVVVETMENGQGGGGSSEKQRRTGMEGRTVGVEERKNQDIMINTLLYILPRRNKMLNE